MLDYTQSSADGGHGTALSKYHVMQRLGSGGMAEIYLARALGIEGFEKHVVLKKILPEHSRNPAFVRMFLDEARLAASLQHQNIAQVYDIGRIADGYFFVMEYLHGRDLRSLKREHKKRGSRLPIHHALTIAAGVAAGLEYAHHATDRRGREIGLVHRDVSPSNIVVTFDGAVKLVDFGIAHSSGKPSETRSGALKGKVPYMSPEQCRGQPLDARSDIFSLGATLYELTTGVSPFCRPGDTDFVVLEKVCAGRCPPPGDLIGGYPERLEAIVMKALAADREQRYPSAKQMLRELEEAAAQLGVPLSATALADHLQSIYGEQPLPWAIDHTPAEDDDDELLCKTIATGSVVEGVTLFEITPHSGGSHDPSTSLRPRRTMMWLGLGSLVAAAGIAVALAVVLGDGDATESTPASKPVEASQPTPTPAAAPSASGPSGVDEPAVAPPPAVEPAVGPVAPAVEPAAPAVEPAPVTSRASKSRAKNRRRSAKSKARKSRKPDKQRPAGPVLPGPGNKKAEPPAKKKGLLDRDW